MARFVPRGGFPFGVRSFEASEGPVEGVVPETVVVAPAGDATAAGGASLVEVRPVQSAGGATAAGGANTPQGTVVQTAGEAEAGAPGAAGAALVFSDDFTTPDAADYDHSSWVPGTFVSDGVGHLSGSNDDYGGGDEIAAWPIGVTVDPAGGARSQIEVHCPAAPAAPFFGLDLGAADTEFSAGVFVASAQFDATNGQVDLLVQDTSSGLFAATPNVSVAVPFTGWWVAKISGTTFTGELWTTDPALGGAPLDTVSMTIDLSGAGGQRVGFEVYDSVGGAVWVDDFQVWDGPEIVAGNSATPEVTVPQSAGDATAAGGINSVLTEEEAPTDTAIAAPTGEAIAEGGANAVIPFEVPTVIRGGGQPTHLVTIPVPPGEAYAEGGDNRVLTREVDHPRVRVHRRKRPRQPRVRLQATTTLHAPSGAAYAHGGTNGSRQVETVPLERILAQDAEFEELLILELI